MDFDNTFKHFIGNNADFFLTGELIMEKKNTLGKRDMTGGRAFAFIGMVLAVFLMVFAFAFRSHADENPVVIPDDYCGWLSFGP